MIILGALIVFAIPLLLRNFLELLQGLMAIVWIILLGIMSNTLPTSDFELTMHRILFITLPMWVFGSFIALRIRSEKVEVEEQHNKSNSLIIDYDISKAEENECPSCFSKRDKDQNMCTNCGYIFD
jgi:ABC-type nickel/cobalt efflux system permease component RcnA